MQVLDPQVLAVARKLVARQADPEAAGSANAASDGEDDAEPQFPSYQIRISTAAAGPPPPVPSRRDIPMRLVSPHLLLATAG